MTTTHDVVAGHDCTFGFEQRGQGVVIAISGDLNWHTVDGLYRTAAAIDTEPKLLIDLDDVTAMDSAGTGALIAYYLRERRAGRQVAIMATGLIADVLQEVGISLVLPVFDTHADAEAWLAAP